MGEENIEQKLAEVVRQYLDGYGKIITLKSLEYYATIVIVLSVGMGIVLMSNEKYIHGKIDSGKHDGRASNVKREMEAEDALVFGVQEAIESNPNITIYQNGIHPKSTPHLTNQKSVLLL